MELSTLSLEAELATIAESAEPGRSAQIAIRHWGWDGRGGATLEATGREFGGITRERVRQLCERLAQRIAAAANGEPTSLPTPVPAPALERALLQAAGAAPTTAKDLARRLADEHVAARAFDPEGLLTAAEVLGHEVPFSLRTVKDVRVVLPNPPDPTADTSEVIAAIVAAARAIVRQAGAARVRDVTGRVAALLAVWVDDDLVTAIVTEPADFVWLERRTGWFYLPSVAKNAVVSRVVKVLSVAGRLDLADLHAGIRRDERMKEFVMPEYILGELCERIPGIAVEDGRVYARKPIRPQDVLETTEMTLVRVLTEHGGVMERHALETLCSAAGMKVSSFNNRIAYSPIIAERGYGRFGLRGNGAEARSGRAGDEAGEADAGPARDDVPRPGDLEHFRRPLRR
ncbi:MAG: hypothetical protein NTW58_01035 [Actinobacteria bacterium]|nr:hypothetical protein [Actinomycetota bacterium]